MHAITLPWPGRWRDFAGEVERCRAQGIGWDEVHWQVGDPWCGESAPNPQSALKPPRPAVGMPEVPRAIAPLRELAQTVLLHRNGDALMRLHAYAEWLRAHPSAWHDSLDPNRRHLEDLARSVRRDLHKMKAFVRFTEVAAANPAAGDAAGVNAEHGLPHATNSRQYIAWFEPEHRILADAAPFFARRFAGMCWAILTPEASVRWDGVALHWGPAGRASDAPPPDAGEALWLTYYERIFNPARVKVAAMKKEMPVRYWKNLPEARRIAPLLAEAQARADEMVATTETRNRPKAAACSGREAPADQAPGASPSLEAIAAAVRACERCDIAWRATQAVAGVGPADAHTMLIGEQPGDREDLEGLPFVGPSGAWLDGALAQLGTARDALYITNAVKHFQYELRGKRRLHKTPAQQEILACQDHLQAEIDAIAPRCIVTLGRTAEAALARLRLPPGCRIARLPHPAAHLRQGHTIGSPAHARWAQALGEAMAGGDASLFP